MVQTVADSLYRAAEAWAQTVQRPAACIFCEAARLWWDGSWARSATVLHDGEPCHVPPFPVRRVRCPTCGKRWGLRPPWVVPHRHYQLELIGDAVQRWLFEAGASLASAAAAVGCAPRSIGRWTRWIAGLAEPAALLRRLGPSGASALPRVPLVRAAARVRSAARRAMVLRAAAVLALLEGLAAVAGLEPPGLRGVLLRAVGDRTRLSTDRAPALPEDAWSRVGPSWGTLAV